MPPAARASDWRSLCNSSGRFPLVRSLGPVRPFLLRDCSTSSLSELPVNSVFIVTHRPPPPSLPNSAAARRSPARGDGRHAARSVLPPSPPPYRSPYRSSYRGSSYSRSLLLQYRSSYSRSLLLQYRSSYGGASEPARAHAPLPGRGASSLPRARERSPQRSAAAVRARRTPARRRGSCCGARGRSEGRGVSD